MLNLWNYEYIKQMHMHGKALRYVVCSTAVYK